MRKPPLQDIIVKNDSRPHHRRQGVGDIERPDMRSLEEEITPHTPRHMSPPTGGEDAGDARAFGEERPPSRRLDTQHDGRGSRRPWFPVALGIGAIVVVCALALSFMFAGATVTVYPKQDTVVVNTTLQVTTDGAGGTLPFEQIVLERTASRDVPAQEEQQVEDRASGSITIFNNYSATPQRLIKNTRFQSENGNIYRIRESVEIPGKSSDDTPGSITVAVYAEEAGDSYNLSSGSFSVPGFVGAAQEGKVYAELTEPIIGGFVGMRRTVDESVKQAAVAELEKQLREELLAAAFESGDKPEGYYLFKEAVFFDFVPEADTPSGEDHVVVSVTGKIHGLLFEEQTFAKRLAELTISSYGGSPIRLDNPYDLSVTATPSVLAEGSETQDSMTQMAPWQAKSFDVEVAGKGHFIWEYPIENLVRDLTGKQKTILDTGENGLLGGYPGIDRMHATIRPFWQKTFPESADDIVVVTELDS